MSQRLGQIATHQCCSGIKSWHAFGFSGEIHSRFLAASTIAHWNREQGRRGTYTKVRP